MRPRLVLRSLPRGSRFRSAVIALAATSLGSLAEAQTVASPGISPFAERKAVALLRDHLPCLGCHTLDGEGGAIGPDLSSVRQRRSQAYIAAMIDDPQRTVPGSVMPRTPMPDETRALIARYLSSLPGSARDSVMATRTLPALPNRDGATLYAAFCAACHGATGRGDGPNAARLPVPPAQLASREAMSRRPDDSLYDTIAAGGAVMNRSPRMPAWGAMFTGAEIRGLVRHIRRLCDCEGPAWSRPPGGSR
jgi:mono/diheme cytochrome c family protein